MPISPEHAARRDHEKKRVYMREYVNARYWRLRLAGLCTICGVVPVGRFANCRTCREARNRYQAQRYAAGASA